MVVLIRLRNYRRRRWRRDIGSSSVLMVLMAMRLVPMRHNVKDKVGRGAGQHQQHDPNQHEPTLARFLAKLLRFFGGALGKFGRGLR